MTHKNINKEHLKDKKHLNDIGVKRFAQNLKRAFLNKPTKPRNQVHYGNSRTSQYYQHHATKSNQPWFTNSHPQHPKNVSSIYPHHHNNWINPYQNLYNPYNSHKAPNSTSKSTHNQRKQELPPNIIGLLKELHSRYAI